MGAPTQKTTKQLLISVVPIPTAIPRITISKLQKHVVLPERGLHAKKPTPSYISRPACRIHISALRPVCSPRPGAFILAFNLSFLGYNSKILIGSQGTFKISFLHSSWDSGWLSIPGRPGAPAAYPQALRVGRASLLQLNPKGRTRHLRTRFPDLAISWTIKLPNENIPIPSQKILTPKLEGYNLKERGTTSHLKANEIPAPSPSSPSQEAQRQCHWQILSPQACTVLCIHTKHSLLQCIRIKIWFVG